MRKLLSTVKKYPALPAFIIVLFSIEAVVRLLDVVDWIFPAPSEILRAMIELSPLLARHMYSTLLITAAGFILALVVAFVSAVLTEQSATLKKVLYSFIVVSQTVPLIFVYPLFVIWFGYGYLPKVIVVALVCYFPVALNLIDGIHNVDQEFIRLFKTMGAKKYQTFFYVKLPSAVPSLFTGLKIAATYSVMGAVISEWMGAEYGLGVFMKRSYHTHLTTNVFAGILVVVILSYAFYLLIQSLEKLLTPWQQISKEFSK